MRERVNTSARLNGLSSLGVSVEGRDVVLGRGPSAAELEAAEQHLLSLDGVGSVRVSEGATEGTFVPNTLPPSTTALPAVTSGFETTTTSTTVVAETPAFDISGVTRESGAVLPNAAAEEGAFLVPSGAVDDDAAERQAAGSIAPSPSTTVAGNGTTLVGPIAPSSTTTVQPVRTIPPSAAAPASTTSAPTTTVPTTTASTTSAPTTTVPTTTAPTTTAPPTTMPPTTAPPTTRRVRTAADAQGPGPRVIVEMVPTDILFAGKVGSEDEQQAVLNAFGPGARDTRYTDAFVVEPGHASLITGALADYLALLDRHGSYASITIEPGLLEVIVEVATDSAAQELAEAATELRSVGWQVDDSLEVTK